MRAATVWHMEWLIFLGGAAVAAVINLGFNVAKLVIDRRDERGRWDRDRRDEQVRWEREQMREHQRWLRNQKEQAYVQFLGDLNGALARLGQSSLPEARMKGLERLAATDLSRIRLLASTEGWKAASEVWAAASRLIGDPGWRGVGDPDPGLYDACAAASQRFAEVASTELSDPGALPSPSRN